MKTKLSILLLLVLCCRPFAGWSCTAVVISGKATPDGRPLMWKNRDTDALHNSVIYHAGGPHAYVAIINSGAPAPADVWLGTNDAGFSIMNTQSFNLVPPPAGHDRGEANGRVMRRALEQCATVSDFVRLLRELPQPDYVEANFGVIDAQGGAVFIEAGGGKCTVFDANDPIQAPMGYVARTNFSYTGTAGEGLGYVRYRQESALLIPAAGQNSFTPQWIMNNLARCFTNPVLNVDLRQATDRGTLSSEWFVEDDLLVRRETANAAIVQGVRKGEAPEFTTLWAALGYPPVSVTLPVWVKGGEEGIPSLLRDDATHTRSVLNGFTDRLLDQVYSYRHGSGTLRYFRWALLYNSQGDGYMQRLKPVEDHVFERANVALKTWRAKGRIDPADIVAWNKAVEPAVYDVYRALAGE